MDEPRLRYYEHVLRMILLVLVILAAYAVFAR